MTEDKVTEIYNENRGMIINEIKRITTKRQEFDDMMQSAWIGVHSAVSTYCEKGGIPFHRYLRACVRRTLRKEAARNASAINSEHMNTYRKSYHSVRSKFLEENGFYPSHNEIAFEMGCSLKTARNMDEYFTWRFVSPDDEDYDHSGMLAYTEEGYKIAEERDYAEKFWQTAGNCLDGGQFEVICLYYLKAKRYAEISRIIGVKAGRVRKMKMAALAKLKESREMQEYRY